MKTTKNVFLAIVVVLFMLVLSQTGIAQGADKALSFDGTDDYVKITNYTNLNFTAPATGKSGNIRTPIPESFGQHSDFLRTVIPESFGHFW